MKFIITFLILLVMFTLSYSRSIPLNVGLGPKLINFNGAIGDENVFYSAIKLELYAVINKSTIRKNRNRVPKKFRKQLNTMSEAHISKIYIPESIIISPFGDSISIYGINFQPIGISLSLLKQKHLFVGIKSNLNITYLFIHSTSLFKDSDNKNMHFFRPGLNLGPLATIKLTKNFLINLGGDYTLYIPQKIDSEDSFLHFGDKNNSIYLLRNLYLTLNFRFNKRY